MKIAITVYTPGQAYFWGSIINLLIDEGHQVFVLSRKSGLVDKILSHPAVEHANYGKSSKSSYGKLLHLPAQFFTAFKYFNRFHPDVLAGASILESNTAAIIRKPCIIFEDTEITPSLERLQWLLTASCVVTPSCFKLDLGKKHLRINGYKELAYLHPHYFRPDPSIFDEMKIQRNEKYSIVRFNSFNAVHDVKLRGFSLEDKFTIVRELEKYTRVFIAAEGKLPEDLVKYKLPISSHRIHHALYYAQLVMGDSGTMISEAAILGTPAIRCNTGLGLNELGNYIELEKRYGLIHCARRLEDILPEALALVQDPGAKEEWSIKRRRMLSEKVDVTRFMVDLIENYPTSFNKLKSN